MLTITLTPQYKSTLLIQSNNHRISFGNNADSVNLSTASTNDEQFQKAKKYLETRKKLYNFLGFGTHIQDYNPKKLEGIQNGIKIFEGLSMKQIAFMFNDLHTITTSRGCFNDCVQCCTDAKPNRDDMTFEDLNLLANGIKELQRRTGLKLLKQTSYKPYITAFHDSDGMILQVPDKNGIIHDFTEISEIIYDATGTKQIFDTAGWNINDKKAQTRAEKYVQYFQKNSDKFKQINISINPFHSTYAKSLEFKSKGQIELAELYRNIYTQRMANAIYTFTPLLDNPKFGFITRAFDDKYEKLEGYRLCNLKKLNQEIEKKVFKMYCQDFYTDKKYVKNIPDMTHKMELIHEKLFPSSTIQTNMLIAGRAKELFQSKYNPNIPNSIYEDMDFAEACVVTLKHSQNVYASGINYSKIIDTTGKVYLNDTYRLIPTDIQLNLFSKDKLTTPFANVEKDFIITEKML